jgi:hypothetical protein
LSSVVLGVRNVTNGETAFSSSTDAVSDDTLQYQVVYGTRQRGRAQPRFHRFRPTTSFVNRVPSTVIGARP